jgi:hypothetical protein
VVGLFLDGASVPEIVQTVNGKSSSDGRAYLKAREKVEAILRRALGQGGASQKIRRRACSWRSSPPWGCCGSRSPARPLATPWAADQ